MKTSIIKSNGVRDSTEERITRNWAAEYAKRLVEKEEAARKNADNAHAAERASGTKYSHVKLSDGVSSTSGTGGATAATPYAVKRAYDKAAEAGSKAAEAADRLNTEIAERKAADIGLDAKIADEVTSRKSGDNALENALNIEIAAREAEDTILKERVNSLEDKAHVHTNKPVLDGITDERVTAWDGIKEQVTKSELNTVTAYLEEICFGLANELKNIYGALGVTVYDGGMFGEEQNDIMLDGGGFNENVTVITDCGGFEPLRITTETGTVVDGGTF